MEVTFADLWVEYQKHLENERRDREISEDNFKIKTRHAKQHLKLIVDDQPLGKCVSLILQRQG